jgi:hypothetical protein
VRGKRLNDASSFLKPWDVLLLVLNIADELVAYFRMAANPRCVWLHDCITGQFAQCTESELGGELKVNRGSVAITS